MLEVYKSWSLDVVENDKKRISLKAKGWSEERGW